MRPSPTILAALLLTAAGTVAVGLDADPPEATPRDVLDHAPFDRLLRKHVDGHGWVDYAGLAAQPNALNAYVEALGSIDLDGHPPAARLATLINAYNAFTLKLIVEHWHDGKLQSIMDIPEARRWDHRRWRLAGEAVSLNQVEHEIIRKRFDEPRIHFALVCAAYSCPKLRNEAYTAAKLETQLEDQTRYSLTHPRWLVYEEERGRLALTKLFDWYAGDFGATLDARLKFVATHAAPAVRRAIATGETEVTYLNYDWRLNGKANAPKEKPAR